MTKHVLALALAGLVTAGTTVLAQVDAPPPETIRDGQTAYVRNCQSCHGANGEGGIGVQLQGNPILQSSAGVVGMIITG
ncbi:MAG: c-type cytochrome [Bauldia sp.]